MLKLTEIKEGEHRESKHCTLTTIYGIPFFVLSVVFHSSVFELLPPLFTLTFMSTDQIKGLT